MSEINSLIGAVWSWLVASSITAAFSMLLAWGCCRLLTTRSAAARHHVWLYALLAVVMLPVLWLYAPKVPIAVLPAQSQWIPAGDPIPVIQPTPTAETVSAETSPAVAASQPPKGQSVIAELPWSTWLVGFWFVGLVWMLGRLTVAAIRMRGVRKRGRAVRADQVPLLTGMENARTLLSDEIEGPVCCGFLQPVVLLPDSLLETEDADELRMILEHELAHVRRRDYLTNLFQRLTEAVLFFHPCVWYMSRELTRERELICDQYVVWRGNSATDYVKLLSKMIERGWGNPSLETTALFEGNLLSRVRTLLDLREKRSPELSRRTRLVSAALATALLLTAGTLHLEARAEDMRSADETAVRTVSSQEPAELDPVKEAMRSAARAIRQYSRRYGNYPKSLDVLGEAIPTDPHSPSGESFHYEPGRYTFVLGSCGPDGQYGNEDDPIFYFTEDRSYNGPHYGTRTEVYPLPQVDPNAQLERGIPDRPRPKGNCSIGGRVVSTVDGEPVDHATVYLFYTGTFAPMFVRVARDGSFLFEDIPPGEYSLRTTHVAGYQDATYNPEGKEWYPRFTVAEGEHRTDVLFELKPAFRISGRVYGEDRGDMLVLAVAERTKEPEGFEILVQGLLEGDGSYRIDGLDGRPVYVMAVDWKREPSEGGYCPQYHPGTFSRDEAEQIAFGEVTEVEDVDIHLERTGGVVLEGTVTDETNRPVSGAFIVAHRSDMSFGVIPAYTDENGRYTITCLGHGEFLVHADAVQHNLVRTRSLLESDGSENRLSLDFVLRRGVKIGGRLVDEQGNAWEVDRDYGYAYIQHYPQPSVSFTMTAFFNKNRTECVQDNFGESFSPGDGDYAFSRMVFPTKSTFVLEGVMAGNTLIEFEPKKEGQALKRILYKDQDITETGLVPKPGDEIMDVIIVIGAES